MGSREMIEFIGEILRETEKAIFFKDEMQEKEEAVWLPLSQIKILTGIKAQTRSKRKLQSLNGSLNKKV